MHPEIVARIAVKALGTEYRGELGMQYLDRDSAVMLYIFREVHRRHASRTELALDPVSAVKGRLELR